MMRMLKLLLNEAIPISSSCIQFRAEMEYQDEVVARAHGIMEPERQRMKLENADNNAIQSDSKLSVLASSLFNGMEDIESSQGIDVEIGGTSGCQGDSGHGSPGHMPRAAVPAVARNCRHGDRRHGGGKHGDGGHGDGSIQSTVFSPRRIRCGKILNRISP
jgi:hypothetical protein